MSEAPLRAVLEVERNEAPMRQYVLDGRRFRIGRSLDNELQVPEGHISKQHAEIRVEQGRFVLVDLGSRAGVFVNGRPVQRHELGRDDVVELGSNSPVRLTFRAVAPVRRASPESTLTLVARQAGQGGMGWLARFFEFSRKLGAGFSLEEVLRDVVDLAIDITGAERGMLILGTAEGPLETTVARGAGGSALPRAGLKASETLVRQSIESGRPCVIEDVGDHADLQLAASIVSLELRSAVTLPLVQRTTRSDSETTTTTVFGVLYLDSRKAQVNFGGFDLQLLERLAHDASSVIENARLLGEAEQRRRIEREVMTAREVQAALMPERFVSTPVFDVDGACVPCHELGGDYVDQFDLGDGRFAFVVADVCGKGIAASLLAATLQGALAAEIVREQPLGEVVARVNRLHCRLAPVGKFITMVVVVVAADGSAQIVNAGHCPVLHVTTTGVREVVTDGMALGLDAEARHVAATLRLCPGDALVLYTDGVPECAAADGSLFGDQRLRDFVHGQRAASAGALLQALLAEVERFRRGAAVNDDLTALIVRRR
ncbi:MAG: SpoIIE family protein phosphatase [Planctomycetes bacterium]|nr:SpoIIE family protein phosphatase [Planctomycetota bacterium]